MVKSFLLNNKIIVSIIISPESYFCMIYNTLKFDKKIRAAVTQLSYDQVSDTVTLLQ